MSNHGQGCTPNFTGGDDGPATTCHQSCPPPSSESRSSTSPNPPSTRRKRCGCDGPANPTSTSAGAPTYAGSTSSTPSGSSKTHSAGPPHQCAPPNKPTAGPGSPSPPTPNFASPAASSMTDRAHGNDPANPTSSHPPASGEGFVNSAHTSTPQPTHRNPSNPDPDDPKAPENRHEPATQPSKSNPTRQQRLIASSGLWHRGLHRDRVRASRCQPPRPISSTPTEQPWICRKAAVGRRPRRWRMWAARWPGGQQSQNMAPRRM